MPTINFGFILCTYLPGVPITVILYITQIAQMLDKQPDAAFKTSITVSYVIISPLIFGILIDALRHFLPYILRWLSKPIKGWLWNPIKERLLKGKKQESINTKQTKICIFWSHWEHYLKTDLMACSGSYDSVFLKHIVNIYAVQYHMYEFFHNLVLSNMIVVLPYLYYMSNHSNNTYPNYRLLFWIVAGISFLSIIFGIIMNKENQALIDEYIKKYPLVIGGPQGS